MGVHIRIVPPHRRVAIEAEIAMHLDRVEYLIARLDRTDGEPDLEDDDPAGDPLEMYGEAASDDGQPLMATLPLYGVDQSTGPINEHAAARAYRAALVGAVPSGSGGWRLP